MLNTHKVDLTMELASFQIRKEDMPEEHRQYRIRNVNYILDADFAVPSAQALQILILCVREMSVCFIKTSCFCVRK